MFSRRCLPPFILVLMAASSLATSPAEPLPTGAIARLGDGWLRHEQFVQAAAFSPDGKTLVTSDFATLYVWDLAAGHCQRFTPLKRPEVIQGLQFSRDGKTLFAGCRLGAIHALDAEKQFEVQFTLAEKGRFLLVFRGPEVSDDGKVVMTVNDQQGSVLLWDVEKRQVRQRFAGDRGFMAATLTRDGKQLVQARGDGSLHVWDIASSREIRVLAAPPDDPKRISARQIGPLAVSPDGRSVAFIRGNRAATVCALTTGNQLWRLEPSRYAHRMAFSPDSKTLAVTDEQSISLRDVASGKEIRRLPLANGTSKLLVFSPDGKTLAAAGPAQGVHLWDVATGKPTRTPVGHTGAIGSLRFLPDGKHLISSSGELIVWDVASAKAMERRPLAPYYAGIAVARDGKTLRILADGSLCWWRIGVDAEVHRHHLPLLSLPMFQLSPNGEALATMTPSQELYVQDLNGERKKRALEGPRIYHSCLSFSPDGRLLAAAGRDGKVRLWSCATGKLVRELMVKDQTQVFFQSLLFTGDGRSMLVVANDVYVFEVSTGKERARLPRGAGRLPTFAITRDGRFVAIPTHDGTIRVYAVAMGKQLAEFKTHQGDIRALAFSEDGRLLASGGVTATILLWKMPDADALPAVENAVEAAALWEELRSANVSSAYLALARLANAPTTTVPLVKTRFQTVWKKPKPARLAQLIGDLDSDTFKVREQATRELAAAGADAIEPLRKALQNKPSLEMRHRIEDLLSRLSKRGSEQFRSLRAIEVLERIGTPEAIDVLRELARKSLPAELHEDIEASLRRLEKRTP